MKGLLTTKKEGKQSKAKQSKAKTPPLFLYRRDKLARKY
jgi:hypothetical protein